MVLRILKVNMPVAQAVFAAGMGLVGLQKTPADKTASATGK